MTQQKQANDRKVQLTDINTMGVNTSVDADEYKLTQLQLARAMGLPASTIKYYSGLGLLPFKSKGGKGWRKYKLETAKAVIDDIQNRKAAGQTMADIVAQYAQDGKLTNGYNQAALLALINAKQATEKTGD